MKKEFGIHELGEFSVNSNAVEITDPCYSPGDGVIVKNVKNGQYICFTEITDEGGWGGRNAVLYAIHKDFFNVQKLTKESLNFPQWISQKESFGVDSGQGGIFDIEKYKGGDDEDFYEKACDTTLEGLGAGTLGFGVVSSSGYGDGGYGYETITEDKEVVGFKIIFIGDEESEEDEDIDD